MGFRQQQAGGVHVAAGDVGMDVDGAGHHDQAVAVDRLVGAAFRRRNDDTALDEDVANLVATVRRVDDMASLQTHQHDALRDARPRRSASRPAPQSPTVARRDVAPSTSAAQTCARQSSANVRTEDQPSRTASCRDHSRAGPKAPRRWHRGYAPPSGARRAPDRCRHRPARSCRSVRRRGCRHGRRRPRQPGSRSSAGSSRPEECAVTAMIGRAPDQSGLGHRNIAKRLKRKPRHRPRRWLPAVRPRRVRDRARRCHGQSRS